MVTPFYDIAFALLVLAPFAYAVVHTQGILDRWIESPDLRLVTIVPTALVATILLAGATAWLGPLQVSRHYWMYTGLAGLVSGFAFLTLDYGRALLTMARRHVPRHLPWPRPCGNCLRNLVYLEGLEPGAAVFGNRQAERRHRRILRSPLPPVIELHGDTPASIRGPRT